MEDPDQVPEEGSKQSPSYNAEAARIELPREILEIIFSRHLLSALGLSRAWQSWAAQRIDSLPGPPMPIYPRVRPSRSTCDYYPPNTSRCRCNICADRVCHGGGCPSWKLACSRRELQSRETRFRLLSGPVTWRAMRGESHIVDLLTLVETVARPDATISMTRNPNTLVLIEMVVVTRRVTARYRLYSRTPLTIELRGRGYILHGMMDPGFGVGLTYCVRGCRNVFNEHCDMWTSYMMHIDKVVLEAYRNDVRRVIGIIEEYQPHKN